MGIGGVGYADISERVIISSSLVVIVISQTLRQLTPLQLGWSMFIGHTRMTFCLHGAHLTHHN